jgi:uncharacterized protein
MLVAKGLMSHFQLSQLETMATAPGASPELVAQWAEARAGIAPPAERAGVELAGYRGGFVDAFLTRKPVVLYFQTRVMPTGYLWEALGLMLIGMGLFRFGFFTGRLSVAAYARIGAVLVPVGIVFGAQLAGRLWMVRWNPVTMVATDALAFPVHLVMAIGYAAAVIAVAKAGVMRTAVDRLAACGRMAFTNYLAASLVTTTLFYGYGFGLYGRLERHQLYLVVLGVWALQLGLSKPWLERFRHGPFEWLWRSLTYLRVQPLRRASGEPRGQVDGRSGIRRPPE